MVFYADIVLLSLVGIALIYFLVAGTPKSFRQPPRHVLICSAHSDDCVILGAEYAYGAVQNGLTVKLAYLTCSGPHPDAEISKIRASEALAAWAALGVPKENLFFADLVQSPIEGPATYSDDDIVRARELFKAVILSLPPSAAVIIPAEGESHIDHRTVRKVTLQAIVDSKRNDLVVYESPEYNMFLSLARCPQRTIRTVLRQLPFCNRLIDAYAGSPNYVNGSPGFIFRDTPNRLEKKKELLRYFVSQDGNLLIRFFGYETPYRELPLSDLLRCPRRSTCHVAFGSCCTPSVLALGIALGVLIFLTAHEIAKISKAGLSATLPLEICLFLFGFSVAVAYLIRRLRRTASRETFLFALAFALGLMSGTL